MITDWFERARAFPPGLRTLSDGSWSEIDAGQLEVVWKRDGQVGGCRLGTEST